MVAPPRILTAYLALVVVAMLACTGGGGDTPAPTVVSTPAASETASAATATATATATASPTAAAAASRLAAPEYAAALCQLADHASTRSFDAFVAAAEAFEGASGAPTIEAVAIAGWTADSAAAWLELAEWTETVVPPTSLGDYHRAVATAAATMALDRGALTEEIGAEADPDGLWILVQRAWAMFQLEPLAFIPGAQDALGVEPSFLLQDCGPLFDSVGDVLPLASSDRFAAYAGQMCWLHALAWDSQQLNLQDLAFSLDPDASLDATVLAGSIYARQEQRIQLTLGLGLQAIAPPSEAEPFHEAVFGNSAERLVAVFRSEVTLESAIASDDVNLALNGLLNDSFTLAEELLAIRDGAPAELRAVLAASGRCGALDGSELAFYEALAS